MENKSNEMKTRGKKASAVLTAVLFAVAICAFCAFTPYPNVKTGDKINGLMNYVDAWKTYTNKYITFKYPDNYKITDEEQTADSYDLCCEIKGDNLSLVQISVMVLDDIDELDESEKDAALEVGLKAMKEELSRNAFYKNFKGSSIKKTRKGKNSGCSFTFTATIFGVSTQGEGFMTISNSKLVAIVMQAENASYLTQLNQIVEGIKIK